MGKLGGMGDDMQELEKILEEIKDMLEDNKVIELNSDGTLNKCVIDAKLAWNGINGIICERMNNGWIPVDERLPKVGEYVLGTNEYDEVMIYRYGWNSRHSRKMFFHECGAAAIITAWMPIPEPYRPKSKTPEEMQEWKIRMMQNFMRKSER